MPAAQKKPIFLQLIDMIHRGKLDNKLEAIAAAVKSRQDALRDMAIAEIEVGNTIQLVNLRPRYLTEYEAEVTGITTSKGKPAFTINLIDAPSHIRRYRTQGMVVPAVCCRKVDD